MCVGVWVWVWVCGGRGVYKYMDAFFFVNECGITYILLTKCIYIDG